MCTLLARPSGYRTGGAVGAGSADLRMWQMPMATCCASALLQALCALMFSGSTLLRFCKACWFLLQLDPVLALIWTYGLCFNILMWVLRLNAVTKGFYESITT